MSGNLGSGHTGVGPLTLVDLVTSVKSTSTFQVSKDARIYIDKLLSTKQLKDPVICLFDDGPPIVAPGLRQGLRGSQVDVVRARDLLTKTLSPEQIDWRLQLRVDERLEFKDAEFMTTDGLTFVMSHDVQLALKNYSLVWADQCLLLIGPGDVAKSLCSVKTLALWSSARIE